jgi:NAD(P)-dependent dehydrogenase (short-subunit alcohol dehydrogenase family)
MMGSTGPADAATDTFVRNLAAEIGPRGVRVVGIWTAGLPETFSREKLAAVDSKFRDSLPGPYREPGPDADDRYVRQCHQRDVP